MPIDPWANIEVPALRQALEKLETAFPQLATAGTHKIATGNTEVSEVETAEITHGLGSAPKTFIATTEQATFVGVSVTELGATKVKVKFGAKTAKEAKLNWYAST